MRTHAGLHDETAPEATSPAETHGPDQDERRSRRTAGIRRKAFLGAAAGVVVGFVLCIGALYLLAPRSSEPPPHEVTPAAPAAARNSASTPAPAQVPRAPVPTPRPRPPASTPTASSVSPDGVAVTLRGLPSDARTRLDGVIVESATLRVPHDGREHVIRVDAPGMVQWRHAFIPGADLTLDVEMRPATTDETPGPASPRRSARPRRLPSLVRNPGF